MLQLQYSKFRIITDILRSQFSFYGIAAKCKIQNGNGCHIEYHNPNFAMLHVFISNGRETKKKAHDLTFRLFYHEINCINT